ncbi:hypothetical protein BV25DRAFT_1827328 [Artomyces pyxidatus]|uniref:Uncharacterized protein n=1 Tax=Artomyces pyxidatus TaxID=48021 RepID=A0ACB8SY61_9AGAM|nr:hypothetical protein BV25DRAFT_1827328 [Artomyces pyxidatus]
MSTTLPLFWNLSSVDKKERIDASVKLVGTLEKLQASFVPKEPSSEGEDEDEHGEDDGEEDEGNTAKKEDAKLNWMNAADVSYSIRRLVRGLASPRESSRLGFAVALTELLSRIDTVTCSQILTLVLDASQPSGSMSGQEERDVLFARLFGLTSLIQSGLIVRAHTLPSSGSTSATASSLQGYTDVLSQLVALGERKSWLRESAWWTIGLAIEALHRSEVDWKEDAVKETLSVAFGEGSVWTPEKVALTVKMQRLWPEREWKKLLAPAIKHGDVLHTSNMATLAKILKESEVEDEDMPKAGGRSWKPQVHYVWDLLLDELLPPSSTNRAPKGSFQEFFRIVVDESLFASSASIERKYWGFEVFHRALPRVKAADLPMLFTKNFMRTWINHLSHFDRYLHNFAKKIATTIHTVVQKNPEIGFSFILQLTGVHGNQQFDKLTKTKTVESLLMTMNVDGIKSYIAYLLKQINEDGGSEQNDIQVTNSRRSWIIEQFAALIRNGAIPKDDEWVQLILDWLTVHGLFVIKKKTEKSNFTAVHSIPSPPLSDDLRKQCRERLLSSVAELTTQAVLAKSSEKMQKLVGVTSSGEFWVARVLRSIGQLEKDTKHVELLVGFDEDDRAKMDKARQVASSFGKVINNRDAIRGAAIISVFIQVSGEHKEAAKGGELLLLSSLLQLYTTDDADQVETTSLESCIDGCSRLFPSGHKQKASKKSIKPSDDEELEPEAIDVLVDTIIGFLERATAYMRAVANQSFSLLTGAVQDSTIDLILAQLERRDPADLVADSDEEMEVDEDAANEEASEGEDDDENDDDDDDSSSEDEEGDKSESEDGDEEEDEELRRKITEALRANGIESATGLSDDESEEEMDDDQMMAIDDQLAQIFRERTKGKGKDENLQREATHFKNRILDLLDLFIKKQPASPFVLRLVIPLLALTFSDEKQLSEKAGGLLKSRIGKLKDVPSSFDKEQAVEVLQDLHTRARKVHSLDALATIAHCSLYVSKILLHAEEEDHVLKAYRGSLVDFTERKASDLNGKFFEDFIKRHPRAAWGLRLDLLKATEKAVNAYRQNQAYGLIVTLLGSLAPTEDQASEISAFMELLRTNLHAALSSACKDSTATPAHVKELLKLVLVAIRQTKRLTVKGEDASRIWQTDLWKNLQAELASAEHLTASTAVHGMCKQVVQLTQSHSQPSKKSAKGNEKAAGKSKGKRKAEAVDGDGGAAATKKVKRKKSSTKDA